MSGPPRGVVYTTGVGRTCPDCAQPLPQCECAARRKAAANAPPAAKSGAAGGARRVVKLRRETQQRGGKVVTLVEGLPLAGDALAAFAKELKQKCGAGGTLRDSIVELQGDQRDKLEPLLRERGYEVKRAGG